MKKWFKALWCNVAHWKHYRLTRAVKFCLFYQCDKCGRKWVEWGDT